MNNGLIHGQKDGNGDTWIIIAADRLSNNGDDYIDFEFLQNTLSPTNSGGFTSAGPNCGRTLNDFLFTLQFQNGGTRPNFFVYRWEPAAGNHSCSPGTSYD